MAKLREYSDLGEGLVAEVLGVFFHDTEAQIDLIVAAETRGDLPGLKRLAHRLKGSAWAIGATGLAEAARAIELGVAEGTLDDPAAAVAAVIAAYQAVRAECAEFLPKNPAASA